MSLRFHLRKHLHELLVRPNQECSPLNSDHFLAIHIFLFQYVKLLADLLVHIGEQGIRQIILLLELTLGLHRVPRDAKHHGTRFLQLFECISEAARLNGASGRIGFRVKKQHYGLARKIAQVNSLVMVILKTKIGYFFMQFHPIPRQNNLSQHFPASPRPIDCCLDTNSMSRPARFEFPSYKNLAHVFCALTIFFTLVVGLPDYAQYVGQVKTSQNNQPTLRAIAVLEYVGPFDHPTASRLVPIAVWDGSNYQPGGQYLAQPVPLTVQTGTQYILEQSGDHEGYFNVKAASNANGSWIAIGNYQKPAPPSYAKLEPTHIAPIMFGDGNGTPHFAHVPAGDTAQGAVKSTTTAQNN